MRADEAEPLRIAVVGAGLIGRRHIQFIADSPRCSLAAVVDPDPAASMLAGQNGAPWFVDLDAMFASMTPSAVADGRRAVLDAGGSERISAQSKPPLLP